MASASIHPTAIVDPSASVGDGVMIGPYCAIDGSVVLGDGCCLKSHVVIAGNTTLGPDNLVYPFAVLGEQTQDLKYEGEPTSLVIGEGNVFREHVTVHRSTASDGPTRIGSHGNFLAYSHVAHDCVVGDHVIFSNNGTLAGHVVVEDYAIIGGLAAVHQFCRIGAHAITGGCTKIVQDVPPFMIADGNPAVIRGVNKVGLERRGFTDGDLRALREAYKVLFRDQLNTKQAVERILKQSGQVPVIQQLVAFVNASERGIIR